MPNIPTFNAPEPDVRISNAAPDAWQRAATRIGELGREGAQDIQRGVQTLGKNVTDFGEAINKQEVANEKVEGIQSLTGLEKQFTDRKNAILGSDPAKVDIPGALTQLNNDEAAAIGNWQGGITHNANKEWAADIASRYTLERQGQHNTDMNNAVGDRILSQGLKISQNIVGNMGATPGEADIDTALTRYDQATQAFLSNPAITNPETRARIQAEYDKDKSQIVMNGLARNPSLATPDILKKYGSILSLDDQRQVQDRINRDAGQSIANDVLGSYLGKNSPVNAGTPVDTQDGFTNATRVANVLRNEYHWSDAAIAGALNSVKTESNGREWNNPGAAGELGIYQFNPASHLPLFEKQFNGDHSVEAQTRYMAQWVNKNMPGYGTSADPAQATTAFVQGFERPKDHSDAAAEARFDGNNAWSQSAIQHIGQQQPGKAPSPQPTAVAGGSVAVGDSLAWGLIHGAGLSGSAASGNTGHQTFGASDTAAIGNTPKEILDQIGKLPDDAIKGKSVVLSTGASNAGGDTSLVQAQIDALKQKGATSITILGVGPKIGDAANQQLQALATKNGAQFSGPITNTVDGIHPKKYSDLAHSLPAAPAPAAAQSGDTTAPGGAPQQQINAAGGSAPGTAQPSSSNLTPYPSREVLIKKILDGPGTPEQKQIAIEKVDTALRTVGVVSETGRAELTNDLAGGLERLKQGLPYQYDENQIRHFFDPKVADKYIGQLKEAEQIGTQIGDIRDEPATSIIANRIILNNSLHDTSAGDFVERAKMVDAYNKAAEAHLKGLGLLPGAPGEKPADPVNYLIRTNPDLANAHNAVDWSNPASAQAYATKMIAWQEHLGLRPDQQHILSIPEAQQMGRDLVQNPNSAVDRLNQYRNTYGPAYQQIFKDLVTLGKLPGAYQLFGVLDPGDAQNLARGLTEQTTASLKETAGTASTKDSYWANKLGNLTGATSNYSDIKRKIEDNSQVQQFLQSMRNTNVPGSQINDLLDGIETLAFSARAYGVQGASTNDGAATYAVNAALGRFEFYEGARVPTVKYDNAVTLAYQTLNKLTVDSISMPRGVGGTGEMTPDQYLALVKSSPIWWTTRDQGGMRLVGPRNMPVLDRAGKPIMINFNDVPDMAAPAASDTVVPVPLP